MKKYFIASIVAILYIPLVTIGAEEYKPLKDSIAKIFWHHWLGKGVILVAVYLIALLVLRKVENDGHDGKWITALGIFAFLGSLTIFGFFVLEYTRAL